MIRPTAPADIPALLAISEAIGLFGPDELEEVGAMLTSHFDNGGSDAFWLTDDDGGPVGVGYCAPERMTQGTWNLLFLAVHPDRQGEGRGAALVRYVEELLTERGAHLLLVETAAGLEQTRAFYRKCGFDEEACIRDYYKAGDDKIIYRKALATQQP